MHEEKNGPIENMRIFLIALVVFHHLACTYGNLGLWYYQETTSYYLLTVLLTTFTAVNQSFFMALFFFISAYFTPTSLQKKGAPNYLKERLIRLGLPLIVFFLAISPLTRLMTIKWVRNSNISIWSYLVSLKGVGFGPLWFAEALLFFTLIYVAGRALLKKAVRPNGSRNSIAPPKDRTIIYCALIIGLVSAAIRLWMPVGRVILPFEFQPSHFVQYSLLFGAGIMAARNQWLDSISYKRGLGWFLTAQVLIFMVAPILLYLGGGFSGHLKQYFGGWHWQSLAYALWEQLVGFSMIMGVLGIFHHKLDRRSSWTRRLSDCSYAVFILHTPILVGLSISIRHLPLDSFFKAIMLAPISLIACFSAAFVMRKIPMVNKVI